MALASGVYAPNHEVTVTHWPLPDANGDGEEVWEGDDISSDQYGNVKRHYNPPEGFSAVPTKGEDGSTVANTYVRRVNGSGAIKRTPTGEAINIYPGETLLEYADGSIKKLRNDKERREFAAAHNKVV